MFLRHPRRTGRAAAALLPIAIAIVGCGVLDGGTPTPSPTPDPIVYGPLCQALPARDEPGNPNFLTGERMDVALTWIPVIAIFEAGIRAAEMVEEVREIEAVTILSPSDDAVEANLSWDTIDDLIYYRQDDYRVFLESHMIEGSYSIADLLAAGTVTTLAGTTLTIGPADSMIRLDDRAETVCADYRIANGRIHIIDNILVEPPPPTEPVDPVDPDASPESSPDTGGG